MHPFPNTHLPLTPKLGVENSPFHISANRSEVDESVNRTNFSIHWLVVKWCNEQSYSFRRSPKWVKADQAQYVYSSSSPITIVVMTLSSLLRKSAVISLSLIFAVLHILYKHCPPLTLSLSLSLSLALALSIIWVNYLIVALLLQLKVG